MSGPQRLSAEAFAVELLREDPNLDYAAIRDRAREADIAVQPIHYGRARKQLGLPALAGARPAPAAPATPPPPLVPPVIPPAPGSASSAPSGPYLTPVRDFSHRQPVMPTPAPAPVTPVAAQPAEEDEEPLDGEDSSVGEPTGGGLVAPKRKGSPAFDYLLQQLRAEPHASYAELRARCANLGYSIAPIMYGRAKAVLGLVPVKPRGKKNAMPARPVGAPLQLRQVESVAADRFNKQLDEVRNLDQLMEVIKGLDTERKRLRETMERIIDMLDEALG
jgi:hypothetical protein